MIIIIRRIRIITIIITIIMIIIMIMINYF